MRKRVSELDLSPQLVTVLKKHNVSFVEELTQLSERELYSLKGVGFTYLNNIKHALRQEGLSLRAPRTYDDEPVVKNGDLNFNSPVGHLDINVSTRNALVKAGVMTVGQLAHLTPRGWGLINGIGEVARTHIAEALKKEGFGLKSEDEYDVQHDRDLLTRYELAKTQGKVVRPRPTSDYYVLACKNDAHGWYYLGDRSFIEEPRYAKHFSTLTEALEHPEKLGYDTVIRVSTVVTPVCRSLTVGEK